MFTTQNPDTKLPCDPHAWMFTGNPDEYKCQLCGARQFRNVQLSEKPINTWEPVDDPTFPKPLTLQLPASVEQYRHDIRRFVDAMIYKLDKHSKKGRWENKSAGDMFPLLEGELKELYQAFNEQNVVNILLEAADVGNYAMIIASIATERGIE